MKKFTLLLCILVLQIGVFAQVSTIRQVYNFAVGDSFEYTYSSHEAPAGPNCASGMILNVITSKLVNADSITYGYSSFTTNTSCLYSTGYGMSVPLFPFPGGTGVTPAPFQTSVSGTSSFQVYNLDSSVFSFPISTLFQGSCDTPLCYTSIFSNQQYGGSKQNYYQFMGLSEIHEIYVDSLGLVGRNNFYENTPSVVALDSLVYYHKANGQTGGQFVPIPAQANSISGSISKNATDAVCAVVYLIQQDTIGHLIAVDSVLTTCTPYAAYSFSNMPSGTYYIKAALLTADTNYAGYLPTYVGHVLQWDSASVIVLPANTTSMRTYISTPLIPGVNTGGPGFVAGWVSQGAGLVQNGQGNNGRAVGSALNNIQINLIASSGTAVAYTYTDSTGHYSFGNLAYGSYKLYAEVPGKIADPTYFTLSALMPLDTNLNISVNSHFATAVQNADENITALIFPNPVSDYFTLLVSEMPETKMHLKIYDITGREIKETFIAAEKTEISCSSLTSGVYYWQLESSAKVYNRGKLVFR